MQVRGLLRLGSNEASRPARSASARARA